MKRGGSPRTEHPPPASLYQPHSAVSLTLFLWISLFLFTGLSSHNQLSSRSHPPVPPQTCLYPGLWSFIQLLCWCLWFSGDMCRSLSVEALQGHRLCFFPPPLPPSSGHTVLPKGKSELSTRTHPQTGQAQSKTQLDNRSSHNIFVSEEISEQYFTFISSEIKDRVCQWIPVIRQKNTPSDDKFFFVRKKWESIGVDNVCLRPPVRNCVFKHVSCTHPPLRVCSAFVSRSVRLISDENMPPSWEQKEQKTLRNEHEFILPATDDLDKK